MTRFSTVCLKTKMAVKWDGFSEEDIKQLKSKGNVIADATRKESSPLVISKRATLSVAARRSCDRLSMSSSHQTTQVHEDIPEEARLSNSKPKSEMNGSSKDRATVADDVKLDAESAVNVAEESLKNLSPAPPFTLSRPRSLVSAMMAPALTVPPVPAIDINDFESRQKMMEEQNRMKKVFLSKALEDRKKQASAEAKRLNLIQEELQKLDQRLSGDVSIIRNQIETASIEFLEAQKRYDRAEKEFLEAKMLFFTKLERKELLTHHLCTIIEQNEMRKAQKLSELMEKLDLRAELPEQTPEQNSEQECGTTNAVNSRKTSAEVILTPAGAGGCGTDPLTSSTSSPDAECGVTTAK